MKITCPSCQSRYSVEDSRVPPQGVTIKCPKCKHSFVAKRSGDAADGKRSTTEDVVALPGKRSAPSADRAVALPGSARAPTARDGTASSEDLNLAFGSADLSEDAAPSADLPAPRTTRPQPMAPQSTPRAREPDDLPGPRLPTDLPAPRASVPTDLPGPRAPADLPATKGVAGGPDMLDFIDDIRKRAGVESGQTGQAEYRVRRRDGRIEGPYGHGRILAMLRARELAGNEDLSEDGVSWHAIGAHAEFNAAVFDPSKKPSPMEWGQVDLPAPGDLPGEPEHRGAKPRSAGSEAATAFDVDGSSPSASATTTENVPRLGTSRAAGGTSAPSVGATITAAPAGARPAQPVITARRTAPIADANELFRSGDLGGSSSGSADLHDTSKAKDFELGELPAVPPPWKVYKTPILLAVGVAATAGLGIATQLFTDHGAFGWKIAMHLFEAPPPPPLEKPAPSPARVVDTKELSDLLDEGSYEAFRSVIATIEGAGAGDVDGLIRKAKTLGFATVSYGPKAFPLADLDAVVGKLATVDLSRAMNGNTKAASLEIAKARALLAIAKETPGTAIAPLEAEAANGADDKEYHLALGLALLGTRDAPRAKAALERAISFDANYAPALHALAEVVVLSGTEDAQKEAAKHFAAALRAKPSHVRSAVRAAEINAQLHAFGARRRMLVAAAEKADRGLPPDQRAGVLFAAASALHDAGAFERALPHAKEAARLEPAKNEYVALLASTLARAGAGSEALATINPVLARAPTDTNALIARADTHMTLHDVAKAFVDLDALAKSAPKDVRVLLLEGRFDVALGKLNDAQKAFERAAALAPNDPRPEIELGRLELRRGDVDHAFRRATRAIALDPYDATAHELAGECHASRQDPAKALEAFETARSLDDEYLAARLGYANVLRDMGEGAPKPSSREDAAAIYREALAEFPKNPTVLFEYGRALELTGKFDEALGLYRQAAALDTADPRAHLEMVAAFMKRTPPDLEQAKKSLRAAVDIETANALRNADARYWEARIAIAERRLADAVAAMRTACELEPRNARHHYWLGKALEANQSLYEAVTYYEKAIELNSRLGEAHRALGWTALDRHLFDKARKAFDAYRGVAPTDMTIWVDIGLSYARQNRDAEAARAFEKALAHDPNNATALTQLGEIESRRGDDAKAGDFFERATRADPNAGESWCQWGLTLSRKGLNPKGKAALKRCVEIESAPEDMKASAREILETSGI